MDDMYTEKKSFLADIEKLLNERFKVMEDGAFNLRTQTVSNLMNLITIAYNRGFQDGAAHQMIKAASIEMRD